MTLQCVENQAQVIATVAGQPFTDLPADLFIPPDALEVLLESFSGPLDLLLYLIRRENINILNIPIAHITAQYLHYIKMMEAHRLELAADYLVMAAMLAEIKSRLLLPPTPRDDEEAEEDPRLELVRRLQIYEQFKQAANNLDQLPRCERDVFRIALPCEQIEHLIIHPEVELIALVEAMQNLFQRQSHATNHQINKEPLSVRERMASVLERLQQEKSIVFTQLLNAKEGRMGLTVTFLAILELARQFMIQITQAQAFSFIHLEVMQDEQ